MARRRTKRTRRRTRSRRRTSRAPLAGSPKVGRRGYRAPDGEVCRCPQGSRVVSTAPKGKKAAKIRARGGKAAARGPGRACQVTVTDGTRVRGPVRGTNRCPQGWTKERYKNKDGFFCLKRNVEAPHFVAPECG